MIPLKCPKCRSQRTYYLGEQTFMCLDCKEEWKKAKCQKKK